MAMSEQDLKDYVERNQHIKKYPEQILKTSWLKARDRIFNAEYDMKTMDKRTKEYSELQKEIAFQKAVMPQIEEALKLLTGEEFKGW